MHIDPESIAYKEQVERALSNVTKLPQSSNAYRE